MQRIDFFNFETTRNLLEDGLNKSFLTGIKNTLELFRSFFVINKLYLKQCDYIIVI